MKKDAGKPRGNWNYERTGDMNNCNSLGQLGEARVRVRISDTDPAEWGDNPYADALRLELTKSGLWSLLASNPQLYAVIDECREAGE